MIGWEIVRQVDFLGAASDVVRHHHERWDGDGYPDGLKGEEIPLTARVFAVADTLDALTTDRPYRPASPIAEARALIREGRGTQFDPAVVDAFDGMPDDVFERIRDGDRLMRKVLIVDDDPFIRKLIATTLEDVAGFELLQASDGAEAVDIAAREEPEIVFLDIDMPRLDGIDACAQICAQHDATAERDDRDAHGDLAQRQRAPRRGRGRGPVPDEAVQPARPAAAGRPDGLLIAYLGLGSNVGDRRANLTAAAEARAGRSACRRSTRPRPQGEVLDQPDFLNAVRRDRDGARPGGAARRDARRSSPSSAARAGGVRHGPRPIDIDILLLGDIEYESERLRIPHRDLETRRFVLEPLRELAPDRVDEAKLAAVQDQRVRRLP